MQEGAPASPWQKEFRPQGGEQPDITARTGNEIIMELIN